MALPTATWYVRITATLGYTAVTKWAIGASIPPGTLRRQNTAPAAGSERVFVAIQSATGTTGGAEPTWVVTKGATTADNTVTWMEATGQAGMNGDLTNCPNWTAAKSNAISAGYVIQNNAGTFLFICTTAGTAGSGAEPTWNTTAGQTTSDNTVTWTSIGAVGNFGNWAAPHARLGNAYAATWSAAGDTIYLGSDHAETAAVAPLNCTGTVTAPILVFSVPTGTIPPTSTSAGASVTFTGSITIGSTSQVVYLFGVTFSTNGSMTFGLLNFNTTLYFDTCTLKITSASNNLVFQTNGLGAASSQRFSFRSCSFVLGNATQSFRVISGFIDFVACTFFGTGTVPTTAFITGTGTEGTFRIRDSDISTVTGNLVNIGSDATAVLSFENCKLANGVALSTGTPIAQGGVQAKVWNCDSIGTNYRFYVATYMATLQASTTVFRSGGASDGTTPISWQIVSTANCAKLLPFVSEEIALWNALPSLTATIYLTCATSLTNNDVYIELEYPDSASSPIGTADLTSRGPLIGSSTPLASDGVSTWTGGLGNNYQIAVALTPAMRGVIKCRIYVGKPSITINVDPVIVVT